MGNVAIINTEKEITEYKPGDLFHEIVHDSIYILTVFNGMYSAIDIQDGTGWRGSFSSRKEAIDGLSFLGRDADITITFNKE
jgi:hypothetical protein